MSAVPTAADQEIAMLEATLSVHASVEVVALVLLTSVGFLRWLVRRLQRTANAK